MVWSPPVQLLFVCLFFAAAPFGHRPPAHGDGEPTPRRAAPSVEELPSPSAVYIHARNIREGLIFGGSQPGQAKAKTKTAEEGERERQEVGEAAPERERGLEAVEDGWWAGHTQQGGTGGGRGGASRGRGLRPREASAVRHGGLQRLGVDRRRADLLRRQGTVRFRARLPPASLVSFGLGAFVCVRGAGEGVV